ncbi:uncharacterized protein LOC132551060 [Ylistrum balloti]|uniref:uncharacterized protein LOC132551060 n=1 Tax=Ylistrum balloti TaxID=509963 RepID=UPI002905DA43|nr:uncharacterized protein LOC132551060 [Ylistrum balloti]XP_060071143.1 uncharacterized protein LOC132551060 [Ylistrum balloti]XP_060071144.1 uncharacterized protein LOC132551060 [Ylistrum balloti]
MEMKHSSSYESKRKAQKEESNESNTVFKKARHEWQIKGESTKGIKVHESRLATELHLNHGRANQNIVTVHRKHPEYASPTIIDSPDCNRISCQSEIELVSNPEFPTLDQTSNETRRRRFNGHPAESIESQNPRQTSNGSDPVASDRITSNNSIHNCDITQAKGSDPPVPKFHLQDQNSSSNNSRREYNPHSSTRSSTISNEFNSFLAKRQNSHIAKAVVDNAINKTLEDMGVSPDTNSDNFVTGKCHVEDAGISQAIQSQGLIPQHQAIHSQGLVSQHQAVCNARLAPILSHVTHLSDMVFSQGHLQPSCLADTQSIILDENSTFATTSDTTSGSMSSSDLLDQAVSMAISSQGLALQRDVL